MPLDDLFESGEIRVEKAQLTELIERMTKSGVKIGNENYNGIRLQLDGDDLSLYLAGRYSESHAGVDSLLKLATGKVVNPIDASNILFGGTGVLKDSVVIDYCKVVDDGVFLSVKDFVPALEELKTSASALLTKWREEDRSALIGFTRQIIDKNLGGEAEKKPEEVRVQVENIVSTCFSIINEYMDDPRVKTLMGNNQYGTQVALFITTIMMDYVERAMPARLPAVEHRKFIGEIINQASSRTSTEIESAIRHKIVSTMNAIATSGSARSEDIVKLSGNVVAAQFAKLVQAIQNQILSAAESFAGTAGNIMPVINRIVDAYISMLQEMYRPQRVAAPVISGRVLLADGPMPLSKISDMVSSLTDSVAALAALFDSVDAAGDTINARYIRSVWENMLYSVDSVPTRTQTSVKDNVMPFLSRGLEPPVQQPELAVAAHQNFKSLMRRASVELAEHKAYKSAVELMKYSVESDAGSQVNDIISKVSNLAIAMGSLHLSLDPDKREDNHPFRDVTVIVTGELLDDYKQDGIDKIALPINRDVPTMSGHLKMLKAIDEVVIMYTTNSEVYQLLNNAVSDSLSGGAVKLKSKKEMGSILPNKAKTKTFVMRKFSSVDEIPQFLLESSFLMLGAAITRTGIDKDKTVSGTFFKDVPLKVKHALFNSIVENYSLDSMRAAQFGSASDVSEAINNDLGDNKLGLTDPAKRAMYLMACKLYRVAAMYGNMSDASPREEAYYGAGKAVAELLANGKLNKCGRFLSAAVRSNDFEKCPFGLSIPQACQTIGKAIDTLQTIGPRDDKAMADDKTKANTLAFQRLTKDEKKCSKCKYARSFMKSESGRQSVVCNFGEANAGVDSPDFATGLGGSYPTSFWAGLFSIPSAMGPEARDSWFARSPGTTPFGQTMVNTPGI